MSAHSTEDISKHVRIYIIVFLALLVGTIVTVGLNYLHFDNKAVTIGIALLVAIVKASLVACYFMHLISEKSMIYVIMGFTVFFFAALMVLTLCSFGDLPELTTTR